MWPSGWLLFIEPFVEYAAAAFSSPSMRNNSTDKGSAVIATICHVTTHAALGLDHKYSAIIMLKVLQGPRRRLSDTSFLEFLCVLNNSNIAWHDIFLVTCISAINADYGNKSCRVGEPWLLLCLLYLLLCLLHHVNYMFLRDWRSRIYGVAATFPPE